MPYRPAEHPGFVAESDGRPVGLLTCRLNGEGACEVLSFDGLDEGRGVGSRLLEALVDHARSAGCRRVCLVTTNDNLRARRFYGRRGFRIAAVRRGAVDEARRLSPEIPEIGHHGISIREELELGLDAHEPGR